MKKLNDIQGKLNEKVRMQAEIDWGNALNKAAEILSPFVRNGSNNQVQMEIVQRMKDSVIIGWNGGIIIGNSVQVPESYVKFMQDKASEEFIKKVDSLQDQLDDLNGRIQ